MLARNPLHSVTGGASHHTQLEGSKGQKQRAYKHREWGRAIYPIWCKQVTGGSQCKYTEKKQHALQTVGGWRWQRAHPGTFKKQLVGLRVSLHSLSQNKRRCAQQVVRQQQSILDNQVHPKKGEVSQWSSRGRAAGEAL